MVVLTPVVVRYHKIFHACLQLFKIRDNGAHLDTCCSRESGMRAATAIFVHGRAGGAMLLYKKRPFRSGRLERAFFALRAPEWIKQRAEIYRVEIS
jgi:hypothetical protein